MIPAVDTNTALTLTVYVTPSHPQLYTCPLFHDSFSSINRKLRRVDAGQLCGSFSPDRWSSSFVCRKFECFWRNFWFATTPAVSWLSPADHVVRSSPLYTARTTRMVPVRSKQSHLVATLFSVLLRHSPLETHHYFHTYLLPSVPCHKYLP